MNIVKVKVFLSMMLCCLILVGFSPSVFAQDDDYTIHVRRDFGYGLGNTIQGRFTVRLRGDDTQVERVTFLMDDEVMGRAISAPFSYQFHTDRFESGTHRLSAEVVLVDGRVVQTPFLQFNFLSQQESRQQVTSLLIGIGSAIILTLVIMAAIQTLVINKKQKGAHLAGSPRHYGLLGGTICPKCGRPFRRHIWGMNLMVGRLDRCDNCSKWVMTVRATSSALQAAEEAELEAMKEDEPISTIQGDKKDLLEDTKYFDEI